ncbi:hypothetical protein [Sorangium cellulosum]|uniref:hypothetical protein n=1 Tax=Sorangium cellulosum TaxID=56 RepID=UPI001F251051
MADPDQADDGGAGDACDNTGGAGGEGSGAGGGGATPPTSEVASGVACALAPGGARDAAFALAASLLVASGLRARRRSRRTTVAPYKQ